MRGAGAFAKVVAGAVGLAAIASCGSSAGAPVSRVSCADAGLAPYQPPEDDAYDEAGPERYACKFDPANGVTATTTVGKDLPPIPLAHVVVLMMENRSFDHYFGDLARLEPGVEGATDRDNPDPANRTRVPQFRLASYSLGDLDHEWGAAHLQYDNGAMDGFVMTSGASGANAMGYYACDDIPFYYWLATTFAISDHHFSSLLGPTWPNRVFMVAGTSCGYGEGSETNDGLTTKCGLTQPNLFKQLDAAKVTYQVFDDGIPSLGSLFFLTGTLNDFGAYADIDDFEAKAKANALPAVLSFLLLTDGTPATQPAIELGGQLARMAHARTTILAYSDEPTDGETAQRQLQETREQIGSGLPALETRHTHAPATLAAQREIERQSYDLVVIAAANFELADHILQAGDHHLLLATRAETTPAHVLICVATGEPGKDDVLFAGRLLRHLGAEVTVLSVVPQATPPQERSRVERFVEAGVRTLALLGVQARGKLRAGAVRDEILAEMAGGSYDMLVLGAPLPHNDRRSTLAGVVGEILSGATERPVLIVRSHAIARKPRPELNRRIATIEEVLR